MKIGIIGTGAFSTSIALSLALKSENTIVMWSENKSLVSSYKKTQKLESLYGDRMFPKNITLTNSYEEVLENLNVLFLMTSVLYLESVCEDIKDKLEKTVPIVIGTKGIAENSNKFVHEIVKEKVKNPLFVLGGPTFSSDVSEFMPIGFQLAGYSKKNFLMIANLFDKEKVKIVFTRDVIGVSLCGCVKNVYAIGAGILAGLGYRESTHALYLTAVFGELEEILYMYDSTSETHHGFAGFGDLILTCSSTTSRNYSYGELLGKKDKKQLASFLKNSTVEGVSTVSSLLPLFKKRWIKAPLLHLIEEIINGKKNPEDLVTLLMEEKKKRLVDYF